MIYYYVVIFLNKYGLLAKFRLRSQRTIKKFERKYSDEIGLAREKYQKDNPTKKEDLHVAIIKLLFKKSDLMFKVYGDERIQKIIRAN